MAHSLRHWLVKYSQQRHYSLAPFSTVIMPKTNRATLDEGGSHRKKPKVQHEQSESQEDDRSFVDAAVEQDTTQIMMMEANEAEVEPSNYYGSLNLLQALPDDIWTSCIFPWLGPGHHAFVAQTCRKLKDCYNEYLDKIEVKPMVFVFKGHSLLKQQMAKCHTFWQGIYAGPTLAAKYHGEVRKKHNKSEHDIAEAIGAGCNIEVLDWWTGTGHGLVSDDFVSQGAARNGHISFLRELRTRGCLWTERTCTSAAEGGQLRTLKWLTDPYSDDRPGEPCPWDTRSVANGAARYGHVNILEWLLDLETGETSRFTAHFLATLVDFAAPGGHLQVAKWAATVYTNQGHSSMESFPWYGTTPRDAAREGHTQFVLWTMSNGCLIGADTLSAAAMNGHIDLIQIFFARLDPCPWDEATCQAAARGGHLECLRYAHINGCAWDEETCRIAARSGHLQCLRYAHKNGCPWDKATCHGAARGGHLECLQYAHENGCPWEAAPLLRAAASSDNLSIFKYAHSHGCEFSKRVPKIISKNDNLDMLKYAREHGCPMHPQVAINAATNGNLAMLQYAAEWACPLSTDVRTAALENGHQHIVAWIDGEDKVK